MQRKYLTVSELAELFRVSPERVKGWVNKGCPCISPSLRSPKSPYTRLLFEPDAVARWLSSFSQPAPPATQLKFPLF